MGELQLKEQLSFAGSAKYRWTWAVCVFFFVVSYSMPASSTPTEKLKEGVPSNSGNPSLTGLEKSGNQISGTARNRILKFAKTLADLRQQAADRRNGGKPDPSDPKRILASGKAANGEANLVARNRQRVAEQGRAFAAQEAPKSYNQARTAFEGASRSRGGSGDGGSRGGGSGGGGSGGGLSSIANLLSQASEQLPGAKGNNETRRQIATQAQALPEKEIGGPLSDSMILSELHDDFKAHEDYNKKLADAFEKNKNELQNSENNLDRLAGSEKPNARPNDPTQAQPPTRRASPNQTSSAQNLEKQKEKINRQAGSSDRAIPDIESESSGITAGNSKAKFSGKKQDFEVATRGGTLQNSTATKNSPDAVEKNYGLHDHLLAQLSENGSTDFQGGTTETTSKKKDAKDTTVKSENRTPASEIVSSIENKMDAGPRVKQGQFTAASLEPGAKEAILDMENQLMRASHSLESARFWGDEQISLFLRVHASYERTLKDKNL